MRRRYALCIGIVNKCHSAVSWDTGLTLSPRVFTVHHRKRPPSSAAVTCTHYNKRYCINLASPNVPLELPLPHQQPLPLQKCVYTFNALSCWSIHTPCTVLLGTRHKARTVESLADDSLLALGTLLEVVQVGVTQIVLPNWRLPNLSQYSSANDKSQSQPYNDSALLQYAVSAYGEHFNQLSTVIKKSLKTAEDVARF